jgi:opacity protein-like surface antigen
MILFNMTKYIAILILLMNACLVKQGQALCFLGSEIFPFPGFYVGGMGGYSGGYDIKCEDVGTKLGFYVGAKVGTKLFQTIRVEGDFIWQRNAVEAEQSETTIQLTHVRGHIHIFSLMTNALIDFNCQFPVRPFIGAGIGYGQAYGHWRGILEEMEEYGLLIEEDIKSKVYKMGFAWQVIAGLKFFIMPGLEANVEYRFFEIQSHLCNHKLGVALTKFF